jgi:hypothetical protein
MTKIPNSKPVLVIEYWNLRFVCNFSFGVPTLWAGPQFGACNLIFFNTLPLWGITQSLIVQALILYR